MPPIQMPPIIPAGEQTERGIAGLQNAMLTGSRLKSAAIEQGEQQRAISKRDELEQLLRRTPEPDRSRAAIEWSKMNDQNLYGKLSTLELEKLQNGLMVNPAQASAMFERNTGEKLQFDEMRGVHLVDMDDGSKIAISARGVERFKSEAAKPLLVGPGTSAIMPGQTEPFYTAPFAPKTERQIERTVDLGNEVEYIYTDGRREKVPKGLTPGQAQPPKSEPGYYLPLLDPKGNITGAWNAKTGSYKTPPSEAGSTPRRSALPSGEKKAASDIEAAEAKIRNIQTLYNPEFVGPVQGRFNLAKIKTPGISIDKNLARFVAANTTLKNEVIKFITGAQMSEPEANRIMQQIPAMEDKPEVWEAKYDITLQNLQILKQKMAESGYVFGGGGAVPAASVQRSKSKSGKPIISRDGGKTWEYE